MPPIPVAAPALGVSIIVSTEQRGHLLTSDFIAQAVLVSIAYSESVKIATPAVPPEAAIA